MANSRTLLVYVFALVVCGSSSSFWVSANTVPVLKEPVAVLGASSPQHLTHQQHQRVQQQQLLTAQHQQIQEAPRTSLLSPSPATPVAAQPQYRSLGASNNNNNAPATYSIKNAWGLSAGNSDSGPYTAGYGYITGRTLQQPVNSPKSDYDLMERPNRQISQSMFEGFTPALQAFFGNGLDIKSIILGGLTTYGVTNLGLPDTMNYLIPAMRWFRSGSSTKSKKEKEAAAAPVKEVQKEKEVSEKKQEPEVVKDVSSEKQVEPVKEATPKNDEAVAPPAPVKDAPSKKEEAVAPNTRRKRDISAQPDTDLTELATMVLSAIQSGECMQRSICILGSQIGASNKGRAAFTLVDKLVPESVQGNQYFVTLKKALRGGESFCDRFRCRLN